jgi:hypothetical protein
VGSTSQIALVKTASATIHSTKDRIFGGLGQ